MKTELWHLFSVERKNAYSIEMDPLKTLLKVQLKCKEKKLSWNDHSKFTSIHLVVHIQ